MRQSSATAEKTTAPILAGMEAAVDVLHMKEPDHAEVGNPSQIVMGPQGFTPISVACMTHRRF